MMMENDDIDRKEIHYIEGDWVYINSNLIDKLPWQTEKIKIFLKGILDLIKFTTNWQVIFKVNLPPNFKNSFGIPCFPS